MEALYDEVLAERRAPPRRAALSHGVRARAARARRPGRCRATSLLGRYPPFVTGGPLPRGHVPVFVFHSLEPESFERKLRYLADNGYVTLSADEYFQVLVGAARRRSARWCSRSTTAAAASGASATRSCGATA